MRPVSLQTAASRLERLKTIQSPSVLRTIFIRLCRGLRKRPLWAAESSESHGERVAAEAERHQHRHGDVDLRPLPQLVPRHEHGQGDCEAAGQGASAAQQDEAEEEAHVASADAAAEDAAVVVEVQHATLADAAVVWPPLQAPPA